MVLEKVIFGVEDKYADLWNGLSKTVDRSDDWLKYAIQINLFNKAKDTLIDLKNSALADERIQSYLTDIADFHGSLMTIPEVLEEVCQFIWNHLQAWIWQEYSGTAFHWMGLYWSIKQDQRFLWTDEYNASK